MNINKKLNVVKKAIIEHLEEILKVIIPDAKFISKECRIGDVYGNAGESLSISLDANKRGLWFDHATQEFGTIIDFIAAHFDLNAKTDIEAVLAKAEAILAGLDKSSFAVSLAIDKTQLKNDKSLEKVAEWEYLNADGTYICTVIRLSLIHI